MKRKPIILSLALLLIVGAALWGVNYRLDHPPLTKADKEFHALIAGADRVSVKYAISKTSAGATRVKILNAGQTSRIIALLRIIKTDDGSETPTASFPADLIFTRMGKPLARFALWQKSGQGGLLQFDPPNNNYQLNPRFNKRLNRTLDAYLPQRIRP